MGNRLSCSCAPLIRKAYRYEDTPWQNARKRDGHLLRLWAEVFHVSTSGSGSVRWQQISEDLVPVNISCIQDHPECVFHITAYNSQVDKILDVRLTQPGTRIGQASECFVYWKDPITNDTWGLNFTSPVDARQFRECCSPASKFSRKASSSYSLRLEPTRQRDPIKIAKRKTLSTPASPSHSREPQCTCMTPEQYARLRAQDPRHRGTVTLPRTQTRAECDTNNKECAAAVSGGVSSSSVYDNISGTMKRSVEPYATIRPSRSTNGNPSEDLDNNSKSAANAVNNAQSVSGEAPSASSQPQASQQSQSNATVPQQQPTSTSTLQQTTQTQTVSQGTTPSQEDKPNKTSVEPNKTSETLPTNPTPKPALITRQFSQPAYNPVQFYEACQDPHESFNHAMRNPYEIHGNMYPGSLQPSPYGFRHPQGYYVPSNAYPAYGLDPTATSGGGFHGPESLYGGSNAGEHYHAQRGGPYPHFYTGGDGKAAAEETLRLSGNPGSRTLPHRRGELLSSKSIDYSDIDPLRDADNRSLADLQQQQRRNKSKSTEDMQGLGASRSDLGLMSFDSTALKRMLQPVTCFESPMNSPMTSPEMSRRRCPGRFDDGFLSEPENGRGSRYSAVMSTRGSDSHVMNPNYGSQRASQPNANAMYKATAAAIGNMSNGVGGGDLFGLNNAHRRTAMRDHLRQMRGHSAAADTLRQNLERSLYLDFERDAGSPSSDNILFDNHCYATTPSSSTGNSDMENNAGPSSSSQARGGVNPASPTSRLLLEYEMHLRNTLAKGLDAESCSLHTFEALLTQSTENLGAIPTTMPLSLRERTFNNRDGDPNRSRCSERGSIGGKDRDGDPSRSFYSDCADMERSMYAERDRGYLSDISSRANSLYERQDSLKSGYMSDRESRHYGVVQQTSLESADSRLCYLTSSEMSDDDRMSLTTAVSDDDDGESEADTTGHGPTKKSVAAASFNCTGALRKAGFLSVKKWLLRKKHQVELARKRGWRGYWVCLKGTTLLFYPCDSREGRTVEAAPKHLIIVDGAIMQPIPEHPKRDFIFCLSTAFGDAYLFQAPCQAELDTWVNSIHCACAASFARHRGKTGTLHLLQEEIFRLERSIESDNKLKHMAEMQLSVVSDPENRRQIGAQISAWEENLERLHCEQFRLRCYMASLQHGELPNPKGLLAHVSRNTKGILNRLGVFTVSSFHAYICARSPSLLNNLLAGRGATRRRPAPPLSRSNSVSSRKSQSLVATPAANENEQLFKVSLPDSQYVTITVRDSMTLEEFLSSACSKRSLNPAEHFVRVKKRRDMDNSNHFVPHRSDLIESYIHSHEVVEVCAKSLYQVELSRSSLDHMWGFSVEAELVENMDRQDELCCFVSRVEDRSVAMTNGIIKGDEIMVINGALVGDLDMMYIESVLQEELSLCLMMRSCRADPPDITCLLKTTDDIIDSLVCPPPPSDALISDDVISGLIVPAPSWSREMQSPGESEVYRDRFAITRQSAPEVVGLLKVSDGDRSVCRSSSSSEARRSSPTGSVASSQSQVMTPNRQLTDAEKLRKVVLELIETERTYVKNLNALLENYLEPLKQETFLSSAEINVLFGNIQEIVAFQRLFLQSLEEALLGQPDFERWDQIRQFKSVLVSVGNSFLYYAQHFKLYSSFCASHSKAQKVLLPNEGSQALQEFLQSRNPKQQHSSTLESYLIKPIQRILKYPLLLQQLKILTDSSSEEHQLLIEALKSMEKVAEHINEMQRIHEEYGAIFEHLFRQHQKSCKQPVDLSPADLLYYGGVEWLNISDFLGKVKKGLELHAMCFVFKTAVVFLCKERLRQKKKLMSVATKASAPEVEIIRYQVLIPVTEVQVRAAATKDLDAHFLWELIHLKNPLHRRSEKVYHLSNSTAEFRNAFLKTIRQIIRESVRNMSIPSAKPGLGACTTILASSPRLMSAGNAKTLSLATGAGSLRRKSPRNAQRHSAGNIDYDNLEPTGNSTGEESSFGTLRARSQTVGDGIDCLGNGTGKEDPKDSDPGAKSESEDEPPPPKAMLGRTPNHLSLSTTSTLSTGSTSSQAKLIQSSNTPQNYQPQYAKPLGSPIWKPRDIGESFTLPRSTRSGATNNAPTRDQPLRASGDLSKSMYGTLAPGHDQTSHSFY